MGLGVSKEENVYFAAQKGDFSSIRKLRQEGASLEWTDSKGRTPLLVACSYSEGFETAKVLLELGANVKAYRPGPEGGYAVHIAAKKGLDKTLHLLLEYGADLLVANDVGQTPMWLARLHGRVSIVRLIEERLALFCGFMRQLNTAAPGFIQVLAKNLVSKKVWVSVLPCTIDPRRPPQFELAIYPSLQNAVPEYSVGLSEAQISIANPNTEDPTLLIENPSRKLKLKLCGEPGDLRFPPRLQIQQLFGACRGNSQRNPPPVVGTSLSTPNSGTFVASQNKNSGKPHLDDEVALKMAIEESLRTAALEKAGRENVLGQQSTSGASGSSGAYQGWDDLVPGGQKQSSKYGGWDTPIVQPSAAMPQSGPAASAPTPEPIPVAPISSSTPVAPQPPKVKPSYNGWDVPLPVDNFQVPKKEPAQASSLPPETAASLEPSAPPLPSSMYPAIYSSDDQGSSSSGPSDEEKVCAVCFTNPKNSVCVPCGHMACCIECLEEIRKNNNECPVCRAQIREVVKVFQV